MDTTQVQVRPEPRPASSTSLPDSTHRKAPPNPPPASSQIRKQGWLAPTILLITFALIGSGLVLWKIQAMQQAGAAAANQPEPMESIQVATAVARQHQRSTVSIGTVVALRSISLQNEFAGTVREAHLTPGQIVEQGTLLVALDTSVEEAELKAQEAEAALAKSSLERMERAIQGRATSQLEVDRARSELDVAEAQSARIRAIIARKTLRAPFRARIGISDVHPGQYLHAGTLLTTLQGVDDAVHVDFAVPQQVAQGLRDGAMVEIIAGPNQPVVPARIVALDALVDSVTRNATIRARIEDAANVPTPGASVRVRVPSGEPMTAVTIPVSALRKDPAGDHVFLIVKDAEGQSRAQVRRVRSGPVLGDDVLILEGLAAGEQVAAQGSFKLRENVLVAIAGVPAGSAAQP